MRRLFLFALIQLAFLAACGGGSSDLTSGTGSTGTTGTGTGTGTGGTNTIAPVGANVVAVTVDGGPAGVQAGSVFNTPYVNVTICAPGSTTNCATIDHVEVDTGSSGVRILASALNALNSSILATLPLETSPVGGTLVECEHFADGITWGPMHTADLTVASEKAASLPIQIIGDPNYPDANIPSDCTSYGSPEDTVALFGANGIIGVGTFVQDCGSFCTGSTQDNIYFNCPTPQTCNDVDAPLNLQAVNPVSFFTTDNNGVILELQSPGDSGATTVSGALVFGINTESNNELGSAKVFTTDDSSDISIIFNGVTYSQSFVDSGSNFTFFNDSAIAACGTAPNQYFCPTSQVALSATIEGLNGVEETVNFNVTNIANLSAQYNAFDNVAAPATVGGTQTDTFDFGLPFFFGRNVFSAIEGANTGSGGVGPYIAF